MGSANDFIEACIKRVGGLLWPTKTADPSLRNNIAIREASKNGDVDTVRLLLMDPRVNPADQHNEAIRAASWNGHTEVVRLLLRDPRVNPSDYDNQAISWASHLGYTEVVQLLLTDPRVDPAPAIADAKTKKIKRLLMRLPPPPPKSTPIPFIVPSGTLDAITCEEIVVGDILVDFQGEWEKYGRCYKEASFKLLRDINPFTRQRIMESKRYIVSSLD